MSDPQTAPRTTTARWAKFAVIGGLVVAVGLPSAWFVTRDDGDDDIRPGTAVALASPSTTAPTTSSPTPSATPSVRSLPPIPTVAGAPGQVPSTVPAVPTRLRVGSLGIDAPVDSMGLDADGAMALPEDVSRVGWYRFGASPASTTGSTVIAGHVDSAEQGDGAMFDLREAAEGEQVLLTTDDGRERPYRIVSREEFDKGQVPLDALFARTGEPRLILITCGGTFDSVARSYESNVVVTAVPA